MAVKRWSSIGLAILAFAGWAASHAEARTAHFEVTVTVTGPGRVTATAPDPTSQSIDCPGACSALVKQKSSYVLYANPTDGGEFTSWGGDCAGSGSSGSCTLYIDGPKSVTAGFGMIPPPPSKFTLTVTKAGTGTGYVGGTNGIDCGPTCAVTLVFGSTVNLLAVPDDGSTFGGWNGGGCATGDQCSVTLNADTPVIATFTHVDRSPPRIRTSKASAAPGRTAQLRYRVYDDSGKSRELLTIIQGKVTIGRVSVPLAEVVYRHVYTAAWRVPAKTKPGDLLYCAVAIDEAGNRSPRSCSLFTVT